jgi:NADPH-dependent 2,4-dienoyl-CoA reductase/sulfur reductase-like enzyme
MPHLFIVGGSDAGISAALKARELAPDWEVTVAVADSYPNFSICGIPYFLSKEVARIDNLAHRKADDIRTLGIELLPDHRAEHIEAGEHRVLIRDKNGEKSNHSYDKLIIATGANSVRPPIPGLDLPGVFLLRWIGDALAFEEFLERRTPNHVIIVGGGYIGLEMAEALRTRGSRSHHRRNGSQRHDDNRRRSRKKGWIGVAAKRR